MSLILSELVDEFSQYPEVSAIALAGSKVTDYEDAFSDHNLYLYVTAPLALAARQRVADRLLRYVEMNNHFWETEDDGQLEDGSEIRLIYRSLTDFEQALIGVVEHHQAKMGMTTCLWYNLVHAKVLFDRTGAYAALQKRFDVPYPAGLKQAVLQRNHGLLRRHMPAFIFQMRKAVSRQDRVALNQVMAKFLASYFDILFAINEQLHPGEKKLVSYVISRCQWIPDQLEPRINTLLRLAAEASEDLDAEVNLLIDALDVTIRLAGRHFSKEAL